MSDPDDPYGWLTANLATLGYVPVGGWNSPGVAGGMADYDTATTVTNVQNNSSYYGAVTDRCVALQAYVPNGKAVPVQQIVAFNVQAIGAPSSEAHPGNNYIWRGGKTWSPIETGFTVAGALPGLYPSPGVVVAYKVIPSGAPMVSIGPTFDGGPTAMAAGPNATASYAMSSAAPMASLGANFRSGRTAIAAASSQAASGQPASIPPNANNSDWVFNIGGTNYTVHITANGTNWLFLEMIHFPTSVLAKS